MRAFLGSCASLITATIVILAPSSWLAANVSNASVSEQVTATAEDSPINPSPTPPGFQSTSNFTLPPIDLSALANSGPSSGDASITIDSYFGPKNPLDVTPGLQLTVSAIGEATPALFASATGAADFTYKFSLDTTQPYSFNIFPDPDGPTLIGPNGAVATGTGNLTAGAYTLTVIASALQSTHSSVATALLFIESVPEPSCGALVGIASAIMLRRRNSAS